MTLVSESTFLDTTPKVKAIKVKLKKEDYIKLKNVDIAKDTINGQFTEGRKIFTNHEPEEWFICIT